MTRKWRNTKSCCLADSALLRLVLRLGLGLGLDVLIAGPLIPKGGRRRPQEDEFPRLAYNSMSQQLVEFFFA